MVILLKRNEILKYLAVICLSVLLLPAVANNQFATLEVVSDPLELNDVASFTPKTILFDETHCDNGSSLWAPGNASMFSWMLGENGYSSSTNFNEELDSGILNDFDILVIFFPVIPLTSGEISAVLSFVDGGGGLLLVGADSTNWWEFRGDNLNPIASTFGINFQLDTVTQIITTFSTHNITFGLTSLNANGDDIDACTLSISTPAISVIDSALGSVVAVSESGLGRVVAVGGPGPFYMYRKNNGGHGNSHFQFSLNVIDWVAGNPARTANVPDEAVITVGTGPSLSSSEVESYGMFTGAIHDHTTHSDGANTPQEMLEKGLKIGFDFFVMSDHSYDTPAAINGITGALAMKAIVDANHIDLQMFIGAELSSVKHTLGFPLTSNIFTGDQQEAVDEIHAQGAFAGFCHPTIGYDYAPVYEARDAYGYDAIEVNNRGYFFGSGEDGFFDDFYGAADTHGVGEDGIMNAVFVENPSGPNGRISDFDLIDAILDKRVVIIDPYNNMIYGQEVWVNRYFEIRGQAEATIQSGLTLVQNLSDAGEDVSLSMAYLEDAASALAYGNPGRALRMAQNATSDVLLGIDLTLTSPVYLDPNTDYGATMTLKNNHTYGVSIDTRAFVRSGVSFISPDYTIEAAGESTSSSIRDFSSNEYGLMIYSLNLYSFNTTEFINPILLKMRGIVDNVTAFVNEEDGEYEVDFTFWMGRASGKEIHSVNLVYNDGSGEEQVAMERGWDLFIWTLGPFAPGTQLDVKIVVNTYEGQVYNVGEQILIVGTATTNTTLTNTTSATGVQTPLDINTLLLIAGAGIGIVVLLIVIVKFRK